MTRSNVTTSLPALAIIVAFAGCVEGAEIRPVNHPDLSNLEPGVQKRLLEGRRRVESEHGTRVQQSEAWGHMGMLYQAYEMQVPAQASYANAIALEENDFRWLYLLAFSHHRMSNYPDAEKFYLRAMEIRPEYQAGWIHLGQVYLGNQQLDKAETAFSRVLKSEPDNAAALTGIARFYLAKRNFEAAIGPLKKALAAQPAASQLHYYLAMAYRQLGNREMAKQEMELRGSTTPWFEDKLLIELSNLHRNSRTYLDNGRTAFERGDLQSAAENYRLALESNPADATTHLALSWVLELLGKTREASEQIDLSLELDPDSAKAHYSKARMLGEAGNDTQAAEHYLMAIAGDPQAEPPKVLLANLRMRQKQFAKAVALFRQIDGPDNKDILVLFRLALALQASGDCPLAIATMKRALSLQASSGTLNQGLIRIGSGCQQDADKPELLILARKMFNAMHSLDSAETLAMALAANGQFDQAISLQQSLLTNLPGGSAKRFARRNLERYQQALTATKPWPADSPFYNPPPPSLADKRQMAGIPTP